MWIYDISNKIKLYQENNLFVIYRYPFELYSFGIEQMGCRTKTLKWVFEQHQSVHDVSLIQNTVWKLFCLFWYTYTCPFKKQYFSSKSSSFSKFELRTFFYDFVMKKVLLPYTVKKKILQTLLLRIYMGKWNVSFSLTVTQFLISIWNTARWKMFSGADINPYLMITKSVCYISFIFVKVIPSHIIYQIRSTISTYSQTSSWLPRGNKPTRPPKCAFGAIELAALCFITWIERRKSVSKSDLFGRSQLPFSLMRTLWNFSFFLHGWCIKISLPNALRILGVEEKKYERVGLGSPSVLIWLPKRLNLKLFLYEYVRLWIPCIILLYWSTSLCSIYVFHDRLPPIM